ncbi:MAG: ATP-dependent helicase, partial [Patescibacteria group bacterium]|nr:ATP-dependent helicase [Patescibacteria group bacterium]
DSKFITMANQFVNLDDLTIDLIDSINPFQHAFEVISKKIGSDVFRIIQDTIAGSRIDMSDDDALSLVPQIEAFVVTHNGKHPMLNSKDSNEKLLAQAFAYLTARRAQWEKEKQNERQ